MLYKDTPKPTQYASQYTKKLLVPSGRVNTGVEVSLSFKIWKFLSHASTHSNFTLFLVKVVKGESKDTNPSRNLLWYPAKPKELLMSVEVNGLG